MFAKHIFSLFLFYIFINNFPWDVFREKMSFQYLKPWILFLMLRIKVNYKLEHIVNHIFPTSWAVLEFAVFCNNKTDTAKSFTLMSYVLESFEFTSLLLTHYSLWNVLKWILYLGAQLSVCSKLLFYDFLFILIYTHQSTFYFWWS